MPPRTVKPSAARSSKPAKTTKQRQLPLDDEGGPDRVLDAASTMPIRAAGVASNPPRSAEGPKLRAWVDGGARGNPGPAGYGAHLEDVLGHTVRDESGFLGTATNNIAEYNGLLAALRAAIELGASALEVFADSGLVVKQMNGVYKVKNAGLRPLFIKAQQLATSLPRFRISHVRREDNREADRLANEAMDRGA